MLAGFCFAWAIAKGAELTVVVGVPVPVHVCQQLTPEMVRAEILNAVLFLDRGVKLFRLRHRDDIGTSGFPNCCQKSYGTPPSTSHATPVAASLVAQ